MSAEWYYEADGQQYGPVSSQQLKQLAGNGFLQPTHLIWKEGGSKKVPASAVKGLFTDLAKGKAPADGQKKPTAAKPAQTGAPKSKPEEMVELEAVEEVVELQPVEEEIIDLQPVEAARP